MCWSCGTELCVHWEWLYKHSVLLWTHMLQTLRCKNFHFGKSLFIPKLIWKRNKQNNCRHSICIACNLNVLLCFSKAKSTKTVNCFLTISKGTKEYLQLQLQVYHLLEFIVYFSLSFKLPWFKKCVLFVPNSMYLEESVSNWAFCTCHDLLRWRRVIHTGYPLSLDDNTVTNLKPVALNIKSPEKTILRFHRPI